MLLTLARAVPGLPIQRRSTVNVLWRFLDMAAARSLDGCGGAGGEPCGVPIGVADVRVMRGAGGHGTSTTGGGPARDGGWAGGGGWKDSLSAWTGVWPAVTSCLLAETAGSIASSSILSVRIRYNTLQQFISNDVWNRFLILVIILFGLQITLSGLGWNEFFRFVFKNRNSLCNIMKLLRSCRKQI